MLSLTDDKVELRRLDACLQALEDLSEQGVAEVPVEFVARFGWLVPGVRVDMPVADALEVVFQAQEVHMTGDLPASSPDGARARRLTRQEAIDITARIRGRIDQVCHLLLEAHDRGAWTALGYRSWHSYVKREFGISRSRSYQLLDQARVRQALSEAAGVSGIVSVNAYAAVQVKGHLPELVAEVRRRRTHPMVAADAHQLIAEVVRETRARLARRVEVEVDPARLADSLAFLSSLPARAAADAIERRGLQDKFDAVKGWISEVAEALDHVEARTQSVARLVGSAAPGE
jgi:hypothetical protein